MTGNSNSETNFTYKLILADRGKVRVFVIVLQIINLLT